MKKLLIIIFIVSLFLLPSTFGISISNSNLKEDGQISKDIEIKFIDLVIKIPFIQKLFYPKIHIKYNQGQSICQTEDNGYIITGYRGEIDTDNPEIGYPFKTFLNKYDSTGNIQWSYDLDFLEGNIGYSVQQTSDNGFISCGSAFQSDDSYAMLLKNDEKGDEEWIKTYSGLGIAVGTAVMQTNDNGYIFTGSTTSLNSNNLSHIFLIKTNDIGEKKWIKTFSFGNISIGYSVQQTKDLGYIICGSQISLDGKLSSIILIKTDESGNEIWNKSFEFMDVNYGYCVKQTSDLGFIISGFMISYEIFRTNCILLKTNIYGNLEWYKTFEDKYGYSVEQTADNGFIIGGTEIVFDKSSALLIKTDEMGNEEWVKTYEGEGISQGLMAQQTNDNGYILTGITMKLGLIIKTYVLLIKTDEHGNLEWIKNYNNNFKNDLFIWLLNRFISLQRLIKINI
jgi:hypothetical protein